MKALSVGTHGIFLVGVSTSSAIFIYETLAKSANLTASTSGANFQVQATGCIVHTTAIPIGINGGSI